MSEKEEPKFLTEKEVSELIKKNMQNVSGKTRFEAAPNLVYQHQADAILNQANPTAGTQYPVLAATKNVRIISIWAKDTWTVQPDPLEIIILIDGQTIIHTVANPTSALDYFAIKEPDLADSVQIFEATNPVESLRKAFLYEGRTVQVNARVGNSTAGTSNPLEARVKYAKIP